MLRYWIAAENKWSDGAVVKKYNSSTSSWEEVPSIKYYADDGNGWDHECVDSGMSYGQYKWSDDMLTYIDYTKNDSTHVLAVNGLKIANIVADKPAYVYIPDYIKIGSETYQVQIN